MNVTVYENINVNKVHLLINYSMFFYLGSSSLGRIQNSGEYSGLRLALNAQQEQYYGNYSKIAGFKVHVHNKNEPPLVEENGFAVMPGTCTFVAVTKTKVRYSSKIIKMFVQ